MAASGNIKLVCFLIVLAATPVALGISDFASELVSYGGVLARRNTMTPVRAGDPSTSM